MKQRIQRFYLCLTLGKREMQDLIHLFQYKLQEVETTIDDNVLVDSTQLDTFNTAYQARSLIIQGYELVTNRRGEEEHELIELKIDRRSAKLFFTSEHGKKIHGVARHIEVLLLQRQDRLNFRLLYSAFLLVFLSPIPVLLQLQYYHLKFLSQMLLTIGLAFFLIPLCLWLFSAVLRIFRINTSVYMYPGKVEITKKNHQNAKMTFILALIFIAVLPILSEIIFNSIFTLIQG